MNDTRQSLMDATRRCVRERGIVGATSREITAAAGVNLAAITYHFGSKDELLAEALFGELERRISPALDSLAEVDDPSAAVGRMLTAVQLLLEEFERSKRDAVVYLEALVMAAHDPRYRRRALGLLRTIRQRLAALIAVLREDGAVPTWVEPDAMAALILAVANGIALQTQIDPRGPDQVAMAGQFAGLLVGVSR